MCFIAMMGRRMLILMTTIFIDRMDILKIYGDGTYEIFLKIA